MTNRISVITSTYDSERYIEENLKSVWNTTKKPFEQVIVDAYSKDNTLKIVKKYANKYNIRILKREPKGIPDAMNFGIKNARGNIIQILHSDDKNINKNIHRQVDNSFNNQKTKWVIGLTKSIDENGKTITTQPHKLFRKYSYLKLILKSFVPHPSSILRKEVFEKFGYFRDDLKITMDYEFWVRIGKKIRPMMINKPWCAFRVHQGGASTRASSKVILREQKKIFRDNLGVIPTFFILPLRWFLSYALVRLYRIIFPFKNQNK